MSKSIFDQRIGEAYRLLFDGHKGDADRFWNTFAAMSVVNAGALILLNSGNTPSMLRFMFPVLGVVICSIWWAIQRSLAFWLTWWEKKLESIEAHFFLEHQAPPKNPSFEIFRNRRALGKGLVSTRKVAQWIPIIFGLSWATYLGVMGFNLYSPHVEQKLVLERKLEKNLNSLKFAEHEISHSRDTKIPDSTHNRQLLERIEDMVQKHEELRAILLAEFARLEKQLNSARSSR